MNDKQQADLDKLGVTYDPVERAFLKDGEIVGRPVFASCAGVTVLDWKATVRFLEISTRSNCTIYPYEHANHKRKKHVR